MFCFVENTNKEEAFTYPNRTNKCTFLLLHISLLVSSYSFSLTAIFLELTPYY